jgi:hypothetical protein
MTRTLMVRHGLLRSLVGIAAAFGATGGADAALLSRVGGQAYYDTVLNVTWVANANLSATNTFGLPQIANDALYVSGYVRVNGQMDWDTAKTWVAAMNGAGYLGLGNWRLPDTTQPDPSCNGQLVYSGFPYQGYGPGCTGSEMGHLYNVSGITPLAPGPFANVQGWYYWSGVEYVVAPASAWTFSFGDGNQYTSAKSNKQNTWPVTPGDPFGAGPDTDGDGVPDSQDNCTVVPNADQRDTNADGYGNLCDPDFNNDGVVNINDFNRLKARLGITPVVDVDTDLDGNGAVNINDLNRLKSFLGKPPGPSGLHPNCPPTCP